MILFTTWSLREAITQSSHVAGICSSGGGMNIQRDQLPPKCTDVDYTPPLPTLFPSPQLPTLLHTHMHTFPSCGGVGPALHRCAMIRPVKASTHTTRACDQEGRKSSCAHTGSREPPSAGAFCWSTCMSTSCHCGCGCTNSKAAMRRRLFFVGVGQWIQSH